MFGVSGFSCHETVPEESPTSGDVSDSTTLPDTAASVWTTTMNYMLLGKCPHRFCYRIVITESSGGGATRPSLGTFELKASRLVESATGVQIETRWRVDRFHLPRRKMLGIPSDTRFTMMRTTVLCSTYVAALATKQRFARAQEDLVRECFGLRYTWMVVPELQYSTVLVR